MTQPARTGGNCGTLRIKRIQIEPAQLDVSNFSNQTKLLLGMERRKEGKSEGVIPSNVEHTGSLERPGKRGALKFRKKKNSRQCEDLATAKWRG